MAITPKVAYQIACTHVNLLLENMSEDSLLELAGLYLINQFRDDTEALGESILYFNNGSPDKAIERISTDLEICGHGPAEAQSIAEDFAATYLTSLTD